MEQNICQSCAMPLTGDSDKGTNDDGSPNDEYCVYCFKGGAFTSDMTMDEMIAHNVQYLGEFNKDAEAMLTEEQAVARMKAFFPGLKRWRNR